MAKSARLGGLGRGLDSLFQDVIMAEEIDVENDNNEPSGGVVYLGLNEIQPNPDQPRKDFDEAGLKELADSLSQHGMIQPIIIRKTDNGYVITAGERRWRAAGIAGMDRIPCLIREYSDEENLLISLIENMQRENLNAIEEAKAFRDMSDLYGMTQEQISKAVGKSRPYISNSMRLLNLPAEIQEMVKGGDLSGGHARALASIDDPDIQIRMAKKAGAEKYSVRQLEKAVSDREKRRKRTVREIDPETKETEIRLSEIIGGAVKLPSSRKKGRIEISFSSAEQFDRIMEKLMKL